MHPMMKMMKPLLLALTALGLGACLPNTIVMQDAKTLDKGAFEATPYVASHSYSEGDNSDPLVQRDFGVQAGLGLSQKLDLRLNYSFATVKDADASGHIFELGPKISLLPDQLAFYMPLMFAFGNQEDLGETFGPNDTATLIPTLLGTFEAVPGLLEINPGFRLLLPFYEDVREDGYDYGFSLVLGLGVSPDLGRFVIRPELDLTFMSFDKGGFNRQATLGLGFTIKSGAFDK